jgi:hypothetical protein
MDWLNNGWVIGIITGVLSGLLVVTILNFFSRKKRDREHQQQISGANREVIYSIRAGIPEEEIPTREVVMALVRSAARKYDVEPEELYQPDEIADELIKEVMDSSFLSASKKSEYCSALVGLGEIEEASPSRTFFRSSNDDHSGSGAIRGTEQPRKNPQVDSWERISNSLIGLSAGLMSAFLAIRGSYPSFAEEFRHLSKSVAFAILIPTLICLLVAAWLRRLSLLIREREILERLVQERTLELEKEKREIQDALRHRMR